MAVDVLLGLQWGDEGKGKIVDFLAQKYQVVARFQGGPNAGHTLEFDGQKHVLHQIPSGIFHKDIANIIGNGVVLDPVVFKREVDKLAPYIDNIDVNLYISKKAQLILPTHRILDAAMEKAKGKQKIGSTLKGIGPAYQDKIARHGIRVGNILEDDFKDRYQKMSEAHLKMIKFFQDEEVELKELEDEFFAAIEFLKKRNLINSEYLINEEIRKGSKILAEGAQGTLLDIDFGSYPFVTSSTTTTAGACTGLGIAPKHIKEVYGIFKAYCTRVGGGPFPTELEDETGEALRQHGKEFGSTTGRPRRCGWLDLPSLKYSIMINGVTQLFMMKADVLNYFDEIQVAVKYKLADGTEVEELPFNHTGKVEPVLKTFKGWGDKLKMDNDFNSLPEEMQEYIGFIEKECGVPVNIVSVGPDRQQTIKKELVF
ncbi:MAG: adenylosuccinate synthase [Candidatus Cyclobacteriaceae bacterium M2_1C_046]